MTAKTDPKPRPYPKILRTTVEADRDLRVYAAEYEIEPYEALVVAIDRLRDPVESESLRASLCHVSELAERQQAEIERLTAQLQSTLDESNRTIVELRERPQTVVYQAALAEIERLGTKLVVAGRLATHREEELASAREATRRADAEVERLTREVAKLGALKSAEIAPVIERFKSAFGADIPQAPSGRAAPQPCACALPDDLAPRLATIAARRGVEPDVMLANVIKNGISKIEASDKYQDRQKAARKA